MTEPRPSPDRPRGIGRLFRRTSWPEARFLADILRTETVGGGLLLAGAVIALVWANSPWGDRYADLGAWVPLPGADGLHLDLSLSAWAADGLLAIFFFVVGLELKREFVAGELRDPRRAALPVVAAVGGMVAPALIYVAVNLAAGGDALEGWAIPTATDIAFALAVLAVVGAYLPQGLRAFLLTLAVVDDLLAISIIAIFYTADFSPLPLLAALLPIAAFGLLVQRRRTWWWALLPLAFTAWTLVHASGVHATVAGVLLGFTVPVLGDRRGKVGPPGGEHRPGLAEHLEHRWRPISAGFAVPVFAFFAAGVSLRDADLAAVLTDPIVLGVVAGLVLGKPLGILGSTYLLARFTRAKLDEDIGWWDLLGVALLAGIGFTVSLLIGELAFGSGSLADDHVKTAVLAGSVLSATLAAVVLSRRNRAYRRIALRERVDADGDGVPDVYQDRPNGH
ncbi:MULTISPECIES: Na+/H+ antiporter NhaA [Micromonospora]|uniref:Na(+)/H(+) antiporter NhaA n=1 Tax=Micromonospora yangpuensis TaxID=683228 RepID=A0A1C6URG3_9ACTN|nr:Na+/H+ antiporter NhaA [Micromonospora yangpuensis]GGM07400.1 Na(+)/H(+) antiporter NhaA [Micromonospora yangpuensis]SCL56399.1 sodium/proton antiporter, NhaA family [Micromonospora yangpuensis]